MKIEKKQILYYVAIIILIILECGGASQIFKISETIRSILLFSAYFLLSVQICNRKHTKSEFVKTVFLIICGIIIYFSTKTTMFLTLILVILASKNTDINKTIKLIFYINLFFLIIHVISYIIYLVFAQGDILTSIRIIENKVIHRYSFFMGHPNLFGSYVFWIIAMYYYLKFDKINILTYIVTVLIALFVYYFPNSRTSAMMIILLIIFTVLVKKKIKIKHIEKIYIIINIILILLMIFENNMITLKVDRILNNRITLATAFYKKDGVNLFGSDIVAEGIKTAYVNGKYVNNIENIDSVYYTLILNYGIVAYTIYSYLMIKLGKKCGDKSDPEIKEKDKIMILMLIIYGISETVALVPVTAFPLLLLSKII